MQSHNENYLFAKSNSVITIKFIINTWAVYSPLAASSAIMTVAVAKQK